MYLRHTTVRKNGKTRTYWRLVRSVRAGSKVRQETVACLGPLDAKGRARARRLAEKICGRDHQAELFDDSEPDQRVRVRLKQVRLERARRFGDVWLAMKLWRALQLDQLLNEVLPTGQEEVPWATMAAVLVAARLTEPSSELHIAESGFRQTALDDLLGVQTEKVNDDRLYRALDQLLPQKSRLEQHLRQRLGELFQVQFDLLIYDVTSTYFEGRCEGNPLAQRGYSRDSRPDCKQVCIGLVVTREGLPLGYELFAGNRSDATTVQDVIATMESRYGRAQRIWVFDRGMVSEANLQVLRTDGRRYVVGTPRSELKQCERALAEKGWTEVREGLEVKLCDAPEGGEVFLLCRSAARREKERAMHERFATRLEQALERLDARLAKARCPQDASLIGQRIGRLVERNRRASVLFDISVEAAPERTGGLRVTWRRTGERSQWAQQTEGCYLLRSNIVDWTPDELWKLYMQLTQAEAAFRIHKSDLGLRPIWHQKPERVAAHILVCFLAYVLWKTLEQWQSRAGLGNSPRTILDELRRIQSADVVLPTAEGTELRLRCVVRPDKAQSDLLARLGLTLPKRVIPMHRFADM